jgi:2,3-bisphosphoglycerate-independent phosphoglycerate mutase
LGLTCGFEAAKVSGATGTVDTDYVGKAACALKELEKRDLVFIHVGATDDASHQGDVQAKVQAIEAFDEHTVGPLLKGLPKLGPHRVLAVCNHATPVSLRRHTDDPVPFVVYEGPAARDRGDVGRGFNEADAQATKTVLADATKLIGKLLGK